MRTPLSIATTSLALLLLAGCTSGDEPVRPSEPATADTAEETSDVGVPMPPAANGYLCRYVSPSVAETVLGAPVGEPTEVTTQDDEDAWVCEGREAEEAFIRVSILRGADAVEELRQAVVARVGDVPQEGPAHLGEVYLEDRTVTSLTMCKVIDSEGSREYEPYALVSEALSDGDVDVRQQLSQVTTGLARAMDQSIGCSPKLALEQAGGDDGAATSAP